MSGAVRIRERYHGCTRMDTRMYVCIQYAYKNRRECTNTKKYDMYIYTYSYVYRYIKIYRQNSMSLVACAV